MSRNIESLCDCGKMSCFRCYELEIDEGNDLYACGRNSLTPIKPVEPHELPGYLSNSLAPEVQMTRISGPDLQNSASNFLDLVQYIHLPTGSPTNYLVE